MSGCALAAIIGAALVVPGIAVLGILAAIALPAYQDYVVKSRVAQAYHMTQELKGTVDEQIEQSGACPDNAAVGLSDDAVFELGSGDAQARASVQVGKLAETGDGHCGILLQFVNVNPNVDGKTLVLESTDNGWTCSGGTLEGKYRPAQCRASNIFTQTDSTP
jgi:type IV pilus assembly protein PilA